MKNKKTSLIIACIFVVLLVGASILYGQLDDRVETNPLSIHNQEDTDDAAKEADKSSGENDSLAQEQDTAEEGNATTEEGNATTEATDTTASETDNPEQGSATASDETTEMNPAPDFTVLDPEGNERKLSEFKGKPVVLNFWASWCGPCKSEMPDFDEAYKEYKDEIHFVMVNLTDGARETIEIASSFISEEGYSFPVYYDTKSEAAMTYAVYSIPTTFFIDQEGNLIAHAQGAINREILQQGIDMIYLDQN